MKIIKLAKSYIAYHGTKNANLSTFDTSFSGKGHDQEGPGIYFSSDETDASGYTNHNGIKGKVLRVKLTLNKVVPLKGNINKTDVKNLMLWSLGINDENELYDLSEEKLYESNLSNYGEDAYSAFYSGFDSIIRFSKSPHDCFMSVWYEFYRDSPVEYLNGMVKLGYDGVIIPKTGCYHYVVFNAKSIEILE